MPDAEVFLGPIFLKSFLVCVFPKEGFCIIHYFHRDHNTPFVVPQILRNHCLQFVLGIPVAPREIEGNANFWGVNKVHYGLCEYNEYTHLLYIFLKSYLAHEHVHYIVVLVCLKGCYRYIKKIFQQLEVTTVYFCLFPEYFVKLFLCFALVLHSQDKKVPKEISPPGFYPLNVLKEKSTEFFIPNQASCYNFKLVKLHKSECAVQGIPQPSETLQGAAEWDEIFLTSRSLTRQEKIGKKERDLCGPSTHFLCSQRPYLWSRLTGFQNRFRFMCSAYAMPKLCRCQLELHHGTVLGTLSLLLSQNQVGHLMFITERHASRREPFLRIYWADF